MNSVYITRYLPTQQRTPKTKKRFKPSKKKEEMILKDRSNAQRLTYYLCAALIAFALQACSKDLPELKPGETPSLDEIHKAGALTLNEHLLNLCNSNGSTGNEEDISDSPTALKMEGFSKDLIIDKKIKLYLNDPEANIPSGYYYVETHYAALDITSEPFVNYQIAASPACGYIPKAKDPRQSSIVQPIRGASISAKTRSMPSSTHTTSA